VTELPLLLCGLASALLIVVGVLALVAPQRLSKSFGAAVSERSALAFVRATGARDLALGAVFGAAVFLQDSLMLLVLALAGFALAFADFAIAYSTAGRFRAEHAAHVVGMIGFAVIVAVLWTRVV
jgi:hypothetical protein